MLRHIITKLSNLNLLMYLFCHGLVFSIYGEVVLDARMGNHTPSKRRGTTGTPSYSNHCPINSIGDILRINAFDYESSSIKPETPVRLPSVSSRQTCKQKGNYLSTKINA